MIPSTVNETSVNFSTSHYLAMMKVFVYSSVFSRTLVPCCKARNHLMTMVYLHSICIMLLNKNVDFKRGHDFCKVTFPLEKGW